MAVVTVTPAASRPYQDSLVEPERLAARLVLGVALRTAKVGMSESDLYEQIAQYMRLKYPGVHFRFDLGGMWTPSHKARNLYGRINNRAWPDLLVAQPMLYEDVMYSGLFLEVKREGTRLKKRDGTWASDHIREQALVLADLSKRGYIAQFVRGFDEARVAIDSYMNQLDGLVCKDLEEWIGKGEGFMEQKEVF